MTKYYHYTTFRKFGDIIRNREILSPREELLKIVDPKERRKLERNLRMAYPLGNDEIIPLSTRPELPNEGFDVSVGLELDGHNHYRISLDNMVDIGVVWGLGRKIKGLLQREHNGRYKDTPVYRID